MNVLSLISPIISEYKRNSIISLQYIMSPEWERERTGQETEQAKVLFTYPTRGGRFGTVTPLSTVVLLFWPCSAGQPAVLFSHTNSAPATSHQSASSIFLSQ
jgi:hypothetical protein